MHEQMMMTYYIRYLREIRNLSDSSLKHYQDALRYISKYLVRKGMLQRTIYEIQDIGELETIRTYLYEDSEFMSLDKRGHQMYSSGLNNYCRFAEGEDFANLHERMEIMDIQLPVGKKQEKKIIEWSRSSIVKQQSIEAAGYLCEVNPLHTTFISKQTGHPYMEGHHALPMKYQDKFPCSLDVYANIVCLCPVCHRLMHYGTFTEKEHAVDKIYHDRADRLAASGLKISRNEFDDLVL